LFIFIRLEYSAKTHKPLVEAQFPPGPPIAGSFETNDRE
jgi:hypothetical protein